LELPLVVDRHRLPALHEGGPDGDVGVLQAAGDEAVDAVGRVVQRLGGGNGFLQGLGKGDPLLIEDLLVPVQDPVVDVVGEGVHSAVGLGGEGHGAGEKSARS
jgi:hypothetical protein